jgi:hypothetical protein
MKIMESHIVDFNNGTAAIMYHKTENGWYRDKCGSYGCQYLRILEKVSNAEIEELQERGLLCK